jgi:hypothetical protein
MQSESLVRRFFRWRFALSVLLVTGALAFALLFGLTYALLTRGQARTSSPRAPSVSPAQPSGFRAAGSTRDESKRNVPRELRRKSTDALPDGRAHPNVESFFPATPKMELPPPLEEPEPPPLPEPEPGATEMSVPSEALRVSPEPRVAP